MKKIFKGIKLISRWMIFLIRLLISEIKGRCWDKLHNVSTAGLVNMKKQKIYHKNKNSSYFFESTGVSVFPDIMKHLNIDYRQFHFLDIGAGKGRTMLMALEFPFKKITGIELSEDFVEITKQNLSTFKNIEQKCFELECIARDALEYTFPNNNLVIYFFNPFNSEILEQLIRKIISTLKKSDKECYLVYLYPRHGKGIEKSGKFQIIHHKKGCDGLNTYIISKYNRIDV